MKWTYGFLLVMLCTAAYADVVGHARVIDGDTIEVNQTRIRLNGIDTPEKAQLLASLKSEEEMAAYIGADSLSFLSVDGLYRAMGHENGRDDTDPAFTDHCFTGDYPTPLEDNNIAWLFETSQLSVRNEN